MPIINTTNAGRTPAPFIAAPDYQLLGIDPPDYDTSGTTEGRSSAMLLKRQLETGQFPTPGVKDTAVIPKKRRPTLTIGRRQ